MPIHGPKNQIFLWSPQPPVADATLEQLLMAWHKCTNTFHVVLIPQLMTPCWRQLFNKACDFTFIVLPGTLFWPTDMFEPLWVGVVLPFTQHRPWCFKQAPLLVEMGGELRRMLEDSEEDAQDLLRKLLKLPGRVANLLQHVACRVLHVPWRDANLPHDGNQGQDRQRVAQGSQAAEEANARHRGRTPVHPVPVQDVLDEESGREEPNLG
jgi:hypothetical protein